MKLNSLNLILLYHCSCCVHAIHEVSGSSHLSKTVAQRSAHTKLNSKHVWHSLTMSLFEVQNNFIRQEQQAVHKCAYSCPK